MNQSESSLKILIFNFYLLCDILQLQNNAILIKQYQDQFQQTAGSQSNWGANAACKSHIKTILLTNPGSLIVDAPEAFQAQAAAWQTQQGQYNTLMQQAATNLQNQIAACPAY